MTTSTPPGADAKPADRVIALDDRRDPRAARAIALRRIADECREMSKRLTAPVASYVVSPEDQAKIDAAANRLRDREACLVGLRADFAPIAAALVSLGTAAGRVAAALQSGEALSDELLDDVAHIARAILNRTALDGTRLEDCASEVHQYAGLLRGTLAVDSSGDVVNVG